MCASLSVSVFMYVLVYLCISVCVCLCVSLCVCSHMYFEVIIITCHNYQLLFIYLLLSLSSYSPQGGKSVLRKLLGSFWGRNISYSLGTIV